MERNMCKQAVVLETIKKTRGRGGMSPAQIQLAEAQTEDYKTLRLEVMETKKTSEETRAELSYVRGQIDLLVKNSQNKNFLVIVLELIRTKSFWTLTILVTILYFCGKYNMNPVELVGSLFKGG